MHFLFVVLYINAEMHDQYVYVVHISELAVHECSAPQSHTWKLQNNDTAPVDPLRVKCFVEGHLSSCNEGAARAALSLSAAKYILPAWG